MDQIANACRKLSIMLEAGVPLIRALAAVREQEKRSALYDALSDVILEIQGGSKFSHALCNRPDVFDGYVVIAAMEGEARGQLAGSLRRQAERIEGEGRIRRRLADGLASPLISGGLSVCVLVMCAAVAMRSVSSAYVEMEIELPYLTSWVFAFADHLHEHWLQILFLCCTAIVAIIGGGRSKAGRWMLHRIYSSLPVIGPCFVHSGLGRASRCMGSLLLSGVSLTKALDLAGNASVSNEVLAYRMRMARRDLARGDSLTLSLFSRKALDPLSAAMLDVGEISGQLGESFLRVADHCEQVLEESMAVVVPVAQLLAYIVVGSLIAICILAAMLPLTCLWNCCLLV